MDKEQRLLLRIDNLDGKLLKEQVQIVNEIGMTDKIRIVGIKKAAMVTLFTSALEKIAAEDEDKLPDSCSNLYNELHTDETSPLDPDPKEKKDVEEKKDKKEKKDDKDKKEKKTGPPKVPVDEYGVREGTLAHTFIQEVKKKPQTMDEVRKAEWNHRGYHFNDTLRRLVDDKQAVVADNDIITIK